LTPPLTRQRLEAAHCWEPEDAVAGRPLMTEFRRRLRYHQSWWREAHGHPIGTQPLAPRPGQRQRLVGSRLPLDYAQKTGAQFVTPAALMGARERTSVVQPKQSFDHQRFWADLLWSPALGVNLFGELGAHHELAQRAVGTLWPDADGTVAAVRFAHSPGRMDPAYLNSLRAFDAVFILDVGDGTQGVVAVDTKYHEWAKPEIPRPGNLNRYFEVAERSGAFASGALEQLKGRSELAVMWLEHLLMFSMLQHQSGRWSWGRYVVVYPAGNWDIAASCERYSALLADDSTYSTMTLEALLSSGALPEGPVAALRERYLGSP
jgi:hypothetical protein